MKTFTTLAIAALLFFLVSCESTVEEVETVCLPLNMTITQVQGSMTSKIIADFHYVEESDLLDHITWSNHQTHYFEYDESGKLCVVKMMKVDTKVLEELWFEYDGNLVEKVHLIKRNLDYVYLEPMDSIYSGKVLMEYNAEMIIREREYAFTEDDNREEFVRDVRYEYDALGNLISSNTMYPQLGKTEQESMTYDQSKHPFGGLQYYFNGESFVNNMVSKSESESGFEFTYDLRLNEYGYPDAIYEKLGSSNTRIFKYAYSVK